MRIRSFSFVESVAYGKRALPFMLFLIGIVVLAPRSIGSVTMTVAFYLYAFVVFWIIWGAISNKKIEKDSLTTERFFLYVMIFSFVYLAVTRLLPFFLYGDAPLGYDTGFYIRSVDNALQDLSGHRLARGTLFIPLRWMGLSSGLILHGLYLISQGLIAGALYMLARSLTKKKVVPYVSVVLFLFAVSLPQFLAFWWMYYQTMLAMAFLLLTLAFLHRRSPLALLTAGFGAVIHVPTFFGFVIALCFFLVLRSVYSLIRWRRVERQVVFLAILGVVGLISAWIGLRILDPGIVYSYVYSIQSFGWLVTGYPEHLIAQYRGLYINPELFRLSTIYLIPFVVSGALLFLYKRVPEVTGTRNVHLFFLLIFLVVLLTLSSFPFIYQHRHLIYLDIVFILFGAYALLYFFRALLPQRLGQVLIAILLIGMVSYHFLIVWKQEPQLYPNELSELRALSLVEDQDSYVMAADALYTPWVYGYTPLKAIGPGYLQDKWDYTMWQTFWSGNDDKKRHQLLQVYRRPIYIFVGERIVHNGLRMVTFLNSDPAFTRVSEHIWRYDPYLLTE